MPEITVAIVTPEKTSLEGKYDFVVLREEGQTDDQGRALASLLPPSARHAREVVEQLRQRSGSLVYHTVIRENIRLAECPSFGQAITAYDGKSAGAADYRALADEIISQEGS
jgi:cellulose biosynthesis protein BcsQ